MRSKILKLAGIGFLLGVAISYFIAIPGKEGVLVAQELVEKVGSIRTAYLLDFFLSGFYGALCMSTTVLYDDERMPMPLALTSLVHGLICIVPFIPLSLFLCWVSGIRDTLIIVAIQTVFYFAVWLIMYMRYRAEVRELNRMTQLQRQSDKKKIRDAA